MNIIISNNFDDTHGIINGKFHINGLRNKDIRSILLKETNSDQNKKNSAKMSRLLKILKTPGVIKKVYKAHCYEVTKKVFK